MNCDSKIDPPQAVTACGGRISDPGRYPSAFYKGERVYFCMRSCLQAFEVDPERFMAGEFDHPVEEDWE